MNTDKSDRDELTIWGAVGPNGQLVKSSVGTFKSVAARWALRRGNYEVVKLGTIPSPGKIEEKEEVPERRAREKPERETIRRGPKPRAASNANGEQLETASNLSEYEEQEDKLAAPKKFHIERSFFGRGRKKRK